MILDIFRLSMTIRCGLFVVLPRLAMTMIFAFDSQFLCLEMTFSLVLCESDVKVSLGDFVSF